MNSPLLSGTRPAIRLVPSPRPLTERQAAVLDYIRSFRRENGSAPSLRQIGAHMGIHSTNGVSDHVKALCRKGYIEVDFRTARGIVLLARPGVPEVEPVSAIEAREELTRENVRLRELLRRASAVLERVSAHSIDVDGVRADLAEEVGR
jgi:SOS-response transcriptional repressor LexA